MPSWPNTSRSRPRTIDNWIASHPAFADAVRAGRVVADARVARGLYEHAVGYSCTVERKVLHDGEERTLKNVVHYPPDTRACIFWLRNRRRLYCRHGDCVDVTRNRLLLQSGARLLT